MKNKNSEIAGMALDGAPNHRLISDRFSSLSLRENSPPEENSLTAHLYDKGFNQGLFSDVKIKAFGKVYPLHKIILYRSSYFASMLSGLWNDGDQEKEYVLELDDNYATQKALEDVLSRMYGREIKPTFNDEDDETANDSYLGDTSLLDTSMNEEKQLDFSVTSLFPLAEVADRALEEETSPQDDIDLDIAIDDMLGVFTVADFLDLPWLVSETVNLLIKHLSKNTIYSIVEFCGRYSGGGKYHDKLTEATRCFICMEGYERGVEWWLGFSYPTICEVLNSDGFFVPTEEDRCDFIVRLYYGVHKHRDDYEDYEETLSALQNCLNNAVHFCHFPYGTLFRLSRLQDALSESPLIKPAVLQSALWLQNELQYRISSCTEHSSSDLGLTEDAAYSDGLRGYAVPMDDTTIDSGGHTDTSMACSSNKNDGDEDEVPRICKTRFPPFRFAVKFSDVSKMPVNKRQYSSSQWYAGTYWNVYIQRVQYKKGGYQLGVYLHRAGQESKETERLDDVGSGSVFGLPERVWTNNGDSLVNFSSFDNNWAPLSRLSSDQIQERPSTRVRSSYTSLSDDSEEKKYHDKRKEVRAYFEMYTPARRSKTALTCFSSVPDNFADSQSWGWKSSSLWNFVIENPREPLKFAISLGVV